MQLVNRVCTVTMLVSALCLAQPAPIPRLAIEHYVLPNGLRVVFHVNRRAPVVHVNIRYQVGAAYERPGRTGFAHLFEHLIGQGVLAGTDFTAEAERIGATNVSGSIRHDFTEFFETVPAGGLERILWLESERFARLAELVTQENLDKQREIVRNERRQKIENRPYGRVNMLLHQNTFPAEHPYAHDAIGTHADLLAATLDDVREFHRLYYTPDNTTLVLAGDFDPEQARSWIAKYYGSVPPGQGIARPARSVPRLTAEKVVDLSDRVPVERYFIGWPAPGQRDARFAALEVAGFVLAQPALRLGTTMAGATTEILPFFDASIFLIHGAPEGIPLEEAEEQATGEVLRLAEDGPTPEELMRAKNNLEFRALSAMQTLDGLATAIHDAGMVLGSPEATAKWLARYRNVTAEQVKEAVRAWITTPNHVSVRVRQESSRKGGDRERSQTPALHSERRFVPPEVRSARLSSGLQVFVMERRELPVVSVQFRMKLGPLQNPPGKEGISLLTMAATKRGTKKTPAEQFDRELSNLAVNLVHGADLESVSAGFDVLTRNVKPALNLLAEALLQPALDSGAFEREQKEWLDRLRAGSSRPDDFHTAAATIAFGSEHPFRFLFGTFESIKGLTTEDAALFHRRHFKPDIASLTFAGDVSLDEAVRLSREAFGEWSGASDAPPRAPASRPVPGRVFLIEREGAAQTYIVQMLPGIPHSSPDLAALTLLDKIRGGMFSSRLMQKIRQEKNYAYEAGSSLWMLSSRGLWFATSPVHAARTKEAVAEFMQELRALREDRPVTEEELTSAKANVIRGYPALFEKSSAAAEVISRHWASGRPMAELQTWPEMIEAVTLEQVRSIARKYAVPDRQVFLLTGDRRVIEDATRELQLGDVVLIAPDGSLRK